MKTSDIIKIDYSESGYLQNYPPHLISDEELCNAFMYNDISYFDDTYPLVNSSLSAEYETLMNAIKFHIARFLSKVEDWQAELPDWVYSYMLGAVVNQDSSILDRHYLLVGLNVDNKDDELTAECESACYELSSRYVEKFNRSLIQCSMESELARFDADAQNQILEEFKQYDVTIPESNIIITRPPTMFGEPHVIKLIRVREV